MKQVQPQSISASELQQWLSSPSASPLLIDVREDRELTLARFPGEVMHFPLSRSGEWIDTVASQIGSGRPVVVLCHAGVRSLHFGLWLLEQNPTLEVWNLEGGIDAWSLQVDSTVPRY